MHAALPSRPLATSEEGEGGVRVLRCYTAPGQTFSNEDEVKQHYRSELHKLNLKRKVAGLAPLTQHQFEVHEPRDLGAKRKEKVATLTPFRDERSSGGNYGLTEGLCVRARGQPEAYGRQVRSTHHRDETSARRGSKGTTRGHVRGWWRFVGFDIGADTISALLIIHLVSHAISLADLPPSAPPPSLGTGVAYCTRGRRQLAALGEAQHGRTEAAARGAA
eukprot:scaffold68448_cov29-Tisochrysis_lutea.AAC.1